jgi:hypothetical protein
LELYHCHVSMVAALHTRYLATQSNTSGCQYGEC